MYACFIKPMKYRPLVANKDFIAFTIHIIFSTVKSDDDGSQWLFITVCKDVNNRVKLTLVFQAYRAKTAINLYFKLHNVGKKIVKVESIFSLPIQNGNIQNSIVTNSATHSTLCTSKAFLLHKIYPLGPR
jgi:hypothetical protein